MTVKGVAQNAFENPRTCATHGRTKPRAQRPAFAPSRCWDRRTRSLAGSCHDGMERMMPSGAVLAMMITDLSEVFEVLSGAPPDTAVLMSLSNLRPLHARAIGDGRAPPRENICTPASGALLKFQFPCRCTLLFVPTSATLCNYEDKHTHV